MDHAVITRRAILGAVASLLSACGGGNDSPSPAPSAPAPSSSSPPPAAPPAPSPEGVDAALEWSTIATDTLLAEAAANPPGLSPMEQSRILAMAFIAGSDAWDAIEPAYRANYLPYVTAPDANPIAAYATAVHHVLRDQVPSQGASLDAAYSTALARIADSASKTAGVNLGVDRAAAILSARANDGSANAQGPYTPGNLPGDYQPTPPVGVATFVNWGAVTPFALTTASQFRAPPPWATNSAAYAADYDEVKTLGAATGSTRTPDQSEIAKFWLESTPLSWQRILNILCAQSYGLDGRWIALVSARLQIAQADAYIAALEAKYYYRYWRPITAIRGGDSDDNTATVGDPAWSPFDPVTPPVPDYVSAHATAAAAGHEVVTEVFGDQRTVVYRSSTLPDVQRTFHTLQSIVDEIGLSRIYVGYHFRKAVEEGWVMGRRVGEIAVGPLGY